VGRGPLRRGCLAIAMAPDGQWLIAYFDGHAVVVQDVTAGRRLAKVAKGNDLRLVQFASDGRYLCTVEGKRTRIWEVSGRELMSVKERLLSDDGITMSPDGRRLALVSRTGIEVWDQPGHRRAIVRRLPQFNGKVWHLAFSADSTKLLFAADLHLELMSLPSGQTFWSAGLPGPVCSAEFAPDDSLLATIGQSSRGWSASLRDAATGRQVSQIGQADGMCGWARFSPDGRFLISAENDNAALWALAY
jgi:WD40 repeat protein